MGWSTVGDHSRSPPLVFHRVSNNKCEFVVLPRFSKKGRFVVVVLLKEDGVEDEDGICGGGKQEQVFLS